jgi:peptidyl-prolyl cis-trans isomerase C
MARIERAVLVLLAVVACGDDAGETRGPRQQGDAEVGGEVIATVDGVAVTAAEVRLAAEQNRFTAREALTRVMERELLSAEAERLGYGDDPEVRTATKRAMVQALLAREIEAAITPAAIPEAHVRARWRDTARYHRPELRVTKHLLARVPRDASDAVDATARAIAREAIRELRAAADPGEVLARLHGQTRDGVQIVTEELPPMHAGSSLEEPYRDAMLSLAAPGVVPEPARTSYGWHAVVVTEIQAPDEVPFERAEVELREEMTTELRRGRLDDLHEELRERFPVRIDDETVRRALADDPLAGEDARDSPEASP